MKKYFIIILFIIIALITGFCIYADNILNQKVEITTETEVEIPGNTSIDRTINILNEKNLLTPGWFFKLYSRLRTKFDGGTLYAGLYQFKPDMTNKQALDLVFSPGKKRDISVTIPEGLTYKEIADILASKAKIDKTDFLYYCRSDSLLRAHGINAKNIEGYLMPETYSFYPGQSAREVIDKLINTQAKLWDDSAYKKARELGYTKHEILTIASIIEAETPLNEEKARISGVYHNRLKKGMLLQADPTVQYAVGKKRLLSRDLEINSPYNTYKYAGLPPGPINNPGEMSIRAALNPEKHKYLYFVATGDGSGKHNFSRTVEQHNIFKAQFKRNLRMAIRKK